MKTILTAIDFSTVTNKVIDTTFSYAKLLGAKTIIVHVATPNPEFVGYEAGPQHVRDQRAHELKNEHQKLEEYAKLFTSNGLEATSLLVQGEAKDEIIELAKKNHAELIVIGSHGRSALRHLLLGSVSTSVIKNSSIPVLVIPDKEN